jgi:hypothetical protein
MTAVDASLTKVGDYIESLESQNINVPAQSYAAQERFLQQKKSH